MSIKTNINSPITSSVRSPRGIIMVGGIRMEWIEWEINSNGFYAADTFRVTLPIMQKKAGIDMSWWAYQDELDVEIFAGFPSDPINYTTGDLKSLILAQVDDLSIDPDRREVALSGRDFTARLIDTKTTEKWQNKRASAIATKLAESHSLTPVITTTSDRVGKYYRSEHVRLTNQRSEWDLLTYLAQEENFQVYVTGKELHFEPVPEDEASEVYLLNWDETREAYPTFPGMRLSFSRNLTLAKDIIVKVHSWNINQSKGFTKIAQASHTKDKVLKSAVTAASTVRTAQVYSKTIPNKTPEQALKIAQDILKSRSRHEMKLVTSLPGDTLLTPRMILRVKGTGGYDQDYYPDSIIRRMSISDGFRMDITAKNHHVESTVSA